MAAAVVDNKCNAVVDIVVDAVAIAVIVVFENVDVAVSAPLCANEVVCVTFGISIVDPGKPAVVVESVVTAVVDVDVTVPQVICAAQ